MREKCSKPHGGDRGDGGAHSFESLTSASSVYVQLDHIAAWIKDEYR